MTTRPAHTPCERRVDGDRVTELIPAREWLARQDKNPLKVNERGFFPPSLPRYQSRDHLHDRNRELTVFDPANPGLQTYVRVTRRRLPDRGAEAALHEKRKDRLIDQCVIERQEAIDANEMLELRSSSIRNLLAARSRGWRPTPSESATAAVDAKRREARMNELKQRLAYMRSTYEYKGYSAQDAAPAPQRPRSAKPPLRGGWPVDTTFHGPLQA